MTIYVLTFLFLWAFLKNSIFLGWLFHIDSSISFIILLFPILFITFSYLDHSFCEGSSNHIHSGILLSILGLLSLSFISSFRLSFLFFLERCVILIVIFIFHYAKDQDKVSSTFFMFLTNIAPSFLFIWFCAGFLKDRIWSWVSFRGELGVIMLLSFLGLLLSKLPIFLLHFWLTKAHVRASGPGSMILASLLLKIGCSGFYKFSWGFLSLIKLLLNNFFSFFLIGRVFLLFCILRFADLKFMVACSSIVHIGPTFPLLLLSDSYRVYSCFLMMIGHGLISYFIFFLVTLIYEISQRKSSYFSKSYESLSRSLGLFLILFFLLNIGFPPFITFLRELLFSFVISWFSTRGILLFSISLLIGGLTFFVVVSKLVFGKKNSPSLGRARPCLLRFSYLYLWFFSVSFMLYCFISLSKTLLCGGKKFRGIVLV